MTPTGLWLDIGAGENGFTKLVRLLFLAGGDVRLLLFWPSCHSPGRSRRCAAC